MHLKTLAIVDVLCGVVLFVAQVVVQSFLQPGHEVFFLNLIGLLTGPILIATGVTLLTSKQLDANRYSVVMKLVVLSLGATFCLMGIAVGTTVVCLVLTRCIRHDFAVATFLHPTIHVSGFLAVVANSLLARRLSPYPTPPTGVASA